MRLLAFGSAASVALLAALMLTNAFAVHDLTFQLDGDVSASTTTSVGGSTQTVDWDTLFTSAGATRSSLPEGFSAARLTRDFKTDTAGGFDTSDDSTFATGSKDTLNITPGWQCNHDANVNSKIDIMNAYATAYTAPNKDQILYFALERNTNTGDANVAFWFLQDAVACESTDGNKPFTGVHKDGDILVVSAFTNGGVVSTIDVYRWNGSSPGSLGTTPVAHGVDCKATSGADEACATVNGPTNGTGGTITTPWLTSNFKQGVGHSLQTAEFFEGGINLTKKNLAGKCFNVFIGDTRSSQSLTATLFDYALGNIGECTSTTTTHPVETGSEATTLTTKEIPAGGTLSVKDKADINVSGVSAFNATVSFHLCGPSALSSTGTCDSGGVDLGSTAVTANGTVTSAEAIVTSVGRYCFRADFSGDASISVPGSSDHSLGECFTITPKTPTLRTNAGAGPVDFGQPVTDTGTLSGTANEPGSGGPAGSNGTINPATAGGKAQGSITFTLYKSDCLTRATGTGTNPQSVNVNGDGTYGPVSFTPDAPGTYHWVATYGGDSPNTNPSTTTDIGCGLDLNEDVVVRTIPSEIKTKQSWIPNDTATVKATVGNLVSGGKVVFSLYDNATCSGTAKYTEEVTVPGGSSSAELSTSNTGSGATGFKITTGYADPADSLSGRYSWKVVYTPAASDTAHTGKQSTCDAEHFNITYTNDSGPGNALP
jgi:hypothetical protein